MRLVILLLISTSVARADEIPLGTYADVTCGKDDISSRAFAALPTGVVIEDKQLEAFTDAVGAGKAPKVKQSKVVEGSSVRGGWCVGEATVKVGKQAMTFVVTGAGELTGHGSDQLVGSAQMIALPVADKDAAKAPKPAAVAGDDDGSDWVKAMSAGLATPEKQSALWAAKRDDLILVGSAPGEVFKGAAARATLAKWKLKLAFDGGIRTGAVNGSGEQLAYVYASVVATPVKGGPSVTYRAFFVLLADHFAEWDDSKRPEHDTWHLVLAHFAR